MSGGVLRISEAANLGLHAMVFLAGIGNNRMVSVSQIADALGVSRDHLGKVLQRLNRLGLATSHKGPGGGFSLQSWQRETTLLEVVEAIDGPLNHGSCMLGTPVCAEGNCLMGGLLAALYTQVHDYLASRKLSSLASTFPEDSEAKASHLSSS